MNDKIKGIIMMVPFILFILIVCCIVIYEHLDITIGEALLYIAFMVVFGIIVLGSFILAIIGYKKYNEAKNA